MLLILIIYNFIMVYLKMIKKKVLVLFIGLILRNFLLVFGMIINKMVLVNFIAMMMLFLENGLME